MIPLSWAILSGDTYTGVKRPYLLSDIDQTVLMQYAYDLLRSPQNYFGDYTGNEDEINDYLETLVHALLVSGGDMAYSVGSVISHISNSPDTGWLLCDGAIYLKADYPELAALIPPSTPELDYDEEQFRVPQLCGRVIVGAGLAIGGIDSKVLGQIGGANTHDLALSEIPAHDHLTYSANLYAPAASGAGAGLALNSAGSGFGDVETSVVGGGNPHNNMQPYQALFVWIRALP